MLQLIKYELLKKRNSKFILLGFLLVSELVFLVSAAPDSNTMVALGMIGLVVTSLVGFFFVALECIFTYYEDLKEKRGYMLFLTPHNEYEILGSKILSGFVTIVAWTVLIGLLAYIDLMYIIALAEGAGAVTEANNVATAKLLDMDGSWSAFLLMALRVVFGWTAMVTTAFLAITLTMTVLQRIKASGIIAFLLFILMNFVVNWIGSFLVELASAGKEEVVTNVSSEVGIHLTASSLTTLGTGISIATDLVFTVAFFLISGYLLHKKLSL